MPDYMEAVFAPAEAIYRAQVIGETFGHLAPTANKTYRGWILFAIGCYSSNGWLVVHADFDDLPNSPWEYDDVHEFVDKEVEKLDYKPGIYRFGGTYKKRKDGTPVFRGTVIQVATEDAPARAVTRASRSNTSTKLEGRLLVWYSYATPIAYRAPGLPVVVRENSWGPTTARHLSTVELENGITVSTRRRLPSDEFEASLTAARKTYGKR